jgi:PKD repeat protein
MPCSILRRLRERHRHHSRGQSLVEFGLVVPILLVLTMTALDFGRVYLGWINLQNMTRIAANFAANNPEAWTGSGDAVAQTKYRNQILADASATNCTLPQSGGSPVVAAPTFADTDGDGSAVGLGDTAEVALSCSFNVITPFISNIVGSSVTVSSSSTFPVKAGTTPVSPVTGGFTIVPVADFTGNGVEAPSTLSGIVPFTVVFRDTSGGVPSAWFWDFADGTTSTLQDPLGHTFATPGTYVVSLTATNFNGSSIQTMGITVLPPSDVDFTADVTSGEAPLTVTFNDASLTPGTAYDWTFGAGEGTGTGATAAHTYNTPGIYDVSLTVTYPDGPISVTRQAFVFVGIPTCTVPQLSDRRRNDAPGIWAGAQFTGTVSDAPGAPTGNYLITTQSLTYNSIVPCDSSVIVGRQ